MFHILEYLENSSEFLLSRKENVVELILEMEYHCYEIFFEIKPVILPRSSENFQSIMMTCSSTSERTMTPQTETIKNRLVTTLTMITYSVKPSMVRYHSNPLYCATHGFSKKLLRVYN
jgi:hypothetical protein